MQIKVKRIYDQAFDNDGYRVLIDRLWPRGVTKNKAKIDQWLRDITPSYELRSWFHEDRANRFEEFGQRFTQELEANNLLIEIKQTLQEKKIVTLITSVKDIEHSHVPVIIEYLQRV